ncbi:MAG: hypothetical protein CV087_23725, partial [Candidatus Brocadia sp. WS118]
VNSAKPKLRAQAKQTHEIPRFARNDSHSRDCFGLTPSQCDKFLYALTIDKLLCMLFVLRQYGHFSYKEK